MAGSNAPAGKGQEVEALGRLFNVIPIAAGVAVTLMLLAQLGLKAWFEAGLGGSAQQVSPEVAEAAFQAGNGLQLGLDVAWDLFLAIGTAMLAWNMRQHPRFGRAYAATGLLLAVALIGLNLAAFPENPGRAGWIDVGPLIGGWYLWVTLRMAWSLRWAQEHRRASPRD